LNVILLSQYFYPEIGATQNRMASLARALVRAGHQVTVITEVPNHPHGVIPDEFRGQWFSGDKREGYDIIRVFVLTSRRKTFRTRMAFYLSFLVMSVIAGLRLEKKPDIILATSPPMFVGLSGACLAFFHKARFVLDIRDLWPAAAVALGEVNSRLLIRLAEGVEGLLYRRADLITTTTQSFRLHVAAHGDAAPAVILPNGTEPEIFRPDRVDPSLRKRLGFEGRLVVGFAGLFGIAQDLDVILETARILEEDDRFIFFLIGAGPEEAATRTKAQSLKLKNVRFHAQVETDQVAPYLLACDILLVTLQNRPLFEKFVPSKLYDFMSCARPVIVNIPGEAAGIVRDSAAGLVIPGGDARALAEAILELSEDPERRMEMGANGRRYVTEKHDRRAIGDRLANHIRELRRVPTET
jgi:glycosyltransferase involved in cell wall biosynthesis